MTSLKCYSIRELRTQSARFISMRYIPNDRTGPSCAPLANSRPPRPRLRTDLPRHRAVRMAIGKQKMELLEKKVAMLEISMLD